LVRGTGSDSRYVTREEFDMYRDIELRYASLRDTSENVKYLSFVNLSKIKVEIE